jgi:hypothetical protein
VEGVGGLVLIIVRNDDTSSGKRLFGLGVTQLGQSEGSRNTHHTGGDERLRVQSHADVSNQDGTSDGSETRAHDLVKLGHGEMSDERLDQHSGFTLTDEGRSRSNDSLGTGNAHRPEEEDSELADEPLDETPVVQELDERHEEDDGRDDTGEEPRQLGNVLVREEYNTVVGESKEETSKLRDEVEDVETHTRPEDEKGNNELDQHSNDDGVPVDR